MNQSAWLERSKDLVRGGLAGLLPKSSLAFLQARGESLRDLLPYEEAFDDEGRTLIQLADGALGTMWELEPIAHEILSESQLTDLLKQLSKIFQAVEGPRVTFQFIFDAEPSAKFAVPSWFNKRFGFAETAQSYRINAIKALAKDAGHGMKLMRRRVFLTLRVEWAKGFRAKVNAMKSDLGAFYAEEADIVAETVHKLREYAEFIEDIVKDSAKIGLSRSSGSDLVLLLRELFHEFEGRDQVFFADHTPQVASRPIRNEILKDQIEWSGDGIGVGADTWEVLSWSGQASRVFVGMMAELLKATTPLRCVVNIRPTHNTHGLDALAHAVKNGGDATRERQRDEVMETERRIAYGERLMNVSLHILYRNIDVKIAEPREFRGGAAYAAAFTAATNIPLYPERFAAFSVFMASLPLAYSRKVAGFTRREARVLSGSVGPYLPVYAGTKGDIETCQLMQNRAGEALWINLRSSPTNPHLAVLGASGGGKSFWLANYLVSELAESPDTMIFHIDCITSCEYAAKALGEDHGYRLYKPPTSYPNLFNGVISTDRLPTLIGVLSVAVNLVSETKLEAAEKVLLADAILKVYEDNQSYAKSQYIKGKEDHDLGHYEATDDRVRLPRLSEIVDTFTILCQKKGIDEAIGQSLREKLLPFFGSGPYAAIFDQETYASSEKRAPCYSLYDLCGIQGDKIVTTLTSLMIIAEIERIADEPVNRGRKGVLVIDELAVTLGGSSRELDEYVEAKWITLRKKGWVCIGLTNSSNHYHSIPAPASIWRVSANKLILPMNGADLQEAHKRGLINNEHYVALVGSLQKKRGAFSEGLLIGETRAGTFSYVPTGYDYWLAANQNADTSNIEAVFGFTGSYQKSVALLAQTYPQGKLGPDGHPARLNDSELEHLRRLGQEKNP